MDDLINEFITETSESLSVLDLELVKLEQNPGDAGTLGNIFRIVHTIKGTCGFLGLPRLEKIAHASENVLGKIRDKQIEATPQAVSLVLESLDCIKAIVEHLSRRGTEPEGDDTALAGRLNQFAESGGIQSVGAPEPHAVTGVPAEGGSAVPAPAALAPEAEPKAAASVAPPQAHAPASAAQGGDQKEGGGGQQSIRISLDVLERLMQLVSEQVLTRNQLTQIARNKHDRDFLGPIQQLSNITTELQETVMKTRMQPIGYAWQKFPRLIRDLSLELGKRIELRMVGADTELDRQLLEMIKDPLTHMVRNSCDHGLEKPDARRQAGKVDTGLVTLSAFHEGGHIIIKVTDDGRGINIDRVREKILSGGMASAQDLAGMSDKQVMQYIFRPGFSTADKVTSVSGRGVGMDVVKTNIEKIGGTVELDSTPGRGSIFSIKIPLTLAIVSVLIVEVRGQCFAIPQINVVEVVRIGPRSAHGIEIVHQSPVMRLRDRLLPLVFLRSILGLERQEEEETRKESSYVAVCNVGGFSFGLVVDRVYDAEEIVVKPVSEVLKSITVYSGNTILGDGSVIMILDPNGIAASVGPVMAEEKKIGTKPVDAVYGSEQNLVSFLVFSTGSGTPKAVPLELVSRLEEIDASLLENAGNQRVVQYRGELMRLICADTHFPLPHEGIVEVIVFNYDRKVLGLAVKEIIDIVEAPFNVKVASREKGFLGSMVIGGRATDVLDMGHWLSDLAGMVDLTNVNVPQAGTCHLLLAEDSPFYRNLTLPLLTAVGYRVTVAENGQQALDMLSHAAHPFALVITDIEMPVMNGIDFALACRGSPALGKIPFVAYTSTLNGDVLRRCREAGIEECILKTDRAGLLEAISRRLVKIRETA